MSRPAAIFTRVHAICQRLVLFRAVLNAPLGQAFATLSAAAAADDAMLEPAYARLLSELVAWAADHPLTVPDPWQDYLLDQVIYDDNPWTRLAARTSGPLPAGLAAAARHDLDLLQQLYQLDGDCVRSALAGRLASSPLAAVDWRALSPDGTAERPDTAIKRALVAAARWSDAHDHLVAHLRRHGAGHLARYVAFRWERDGRHGHLCGIPRPDPIRLDQLVGYERQRAMLLQNTEQFLAGLPANNLLLYGDRGTGKSSFVKALVHTYAPHGLRLVEMPKQYLADFPALVAQLAEYPQRFLVFLDDLSFEEHETHYKDLKALLEGGIQARPANVLLYATSNRRHLVREHYRDRQVGFTPDDEVQPQDTMQERLSLADRFGMVLVFRSPHREQYLAIVRALATHAGLELPAEDLERRALRWAAWHGGMTGRAARQFIDHLCGELMLERQRRWTEDAERVSPPASIRGRETGAT